MNVINCSACQDKMVLVKPPGDTPIYCGNCQNTGPVIPQPGTQFCIINITADEGLTIFAYPDKQTRDERIRVLLDTANSGELNYTLDVEGKVVEYGEDIS